MPEFEKVQPGVMIPGMIEIVQGEKDHVFKGGFKDKKTGVVAPDVTCSGFRVVFALENYNYRHFDRWQKGGFNPKSNLYKKYIEKLVENKPEEKKRTFEEQLAYLKNLEGMTVNTIWKGDNFQEVEAVYPIDPKITIK